MEEVLSSKGPEVNTGEKLPEGNFEFSSDKEKGLAVVHNKAGELEVVVTTPLKADVFRDGRLVMIENLDKTKTTVIEFGIAAVSKEGSSGCAIMNLQFDRDTILRILGAATLNGMIPEQPKSKWAPGGKMDQMVELALKLNKSLGED